MFFLKIVSLVLGQRKKMYSSLRFVLDKCVCKVAILFSNDFLTQNNFLSDTPAMLNKTSKAFLEYCTIANIMVYELEHSNHYQFAKKEIKEVEAHTQLQLIKRNAL